MDNKPSPAFLRKQVYDFLAQNGILLDTKHHAELSKILKSVYEYRVIESRKENDAPLKHEVVCPKCQGIKIIHKNGFKRYKRNIKHNGGTVEASPL